MTGTRYPPFIPVLCLNLDKGVIVDVPFYGTFRLINYQCVVHDGQPYFCIEGSHIVAPPYISTSHLYVPWDNFIISREILGWKEWTQIKLWYLMVVSIHCSLLELKKWM